MEEGLNILFIDPDTEVRKFALVMLFTKHPELVTQYKNSEITDVVSHASTKTLDANLVKKLTLLLREHIMPAPSSH